MNRDDVLILHDSDGRAETSARCRVVERVALVAILGLSVCVSMVGITWGLPGRSIDPFLFGDDEPWPGEKIYRLAHAEGKFLPTRGADVDADPLDIASDGPINLTATPEDVARIYLRYRLYTYQPDEMITMMALAGMSPGRFDFDPRLYQYGGLFIYPVGALIRLCGAVGLIDVRGDVVYYLDNPDEFAKFYVVARAYAAAWGLLGVVIVFAIARRLGGSRAGVLAALLFVLMPVVVCMSHEGKPHLPGAVLMLAAVLFAMRHFDIGMRARACSAAAQGSRRGLKPRHKRQHDAPAGACDVESKAGTSATGGGRYEETMGFPAPTAGSYWWMCVCCGAACGMVLSSVPVLVLIPLAAWLGERHRMVKRIVLGMALAGGAYLLTNPYVVINALANRDVLQSNFGNSLAMYNVARIGEGLVRVLELTVEGATLPILLLGAAALIAALLRRCGVSARGREMAPLVVVASVFFLQFVLIGAGKPGEYGRFGIFTDTALGIGAACLLAGRRAGRFKVALCGMAALFVVVWVGLGGAVYLFKFVEDSSGVGSRLALARSCRSLATDPQTGRYVAALGVPAAPAPYSLPPVNFARTDVWLYPSKSRLLHGPKDAETFPITPVDRRMDDRRVDVAGDGGTAFFPPWPREQFSVSWREWLRRADASISWADKPFTVGAALFADADPGRPPHTETAP